MLIEINRRVHLVHCCSEYTPQAIAKMANKLNQRGFDSGLYSRNISDDDAFNRRKNGRVPHAFSDLLFNLVALWPTHDDVGPYAIASIVECSIFQLCLR